MTRSQPNLTKNVDSEIIKSVKGLLADKNIEGSTYVKLIDQFYRESILNRKGKVSGSTQPVTDYIAELLLTNPKCHLDFGDIIGICRGDDKLYKVAHKSLIRPKSKSYAEVIKAKEIFNHGNIKCIGKILDYQIPLNDARSDKMGKIDLLAYDDKSNILRILELKVSGNVSDSLLRSILEGETYKSVLMNMKRKKITNSKYSNGIAKVMDEYALMKDAKVVACPLLLVKDEDNIGFRAYEEFCNPKDFEHVFKLANSLQQEIIIIYECLQDCFAKN